VSSRVAAAPVLACPWIPPTPDESWFWKVQNGRTRHPRQKIQDALYGDSTPIEEGQTSKRHLFSLVRVLLGPAQQAPSPSTTKSPKHPVGAANTKGEADCDPWPRNISTPLGCAARSVHPIASHNSDGGWLRAGLWREATPKRSPHLPPK